jgi:formylglycine-generating enzyme required for sulfatase activity
MRNLFLTAWLLILLIVCAPPIAAEDICNPQPYPDDVVLPMPGNMNMVFRPVFLNTGEKPFALKEFRVGGDKQAGFKEFITDVALGGSFVQKNDWLYYLGKYEVSQAQYDAIMNPGVQSQSKKPVNNISWFEAQEFIHKYNLWLYENALDRLPRNEDAYGFIRLPTEVEWEFAARGGTAVNNSVFDQKHPYPPTAINKYEWFVGHTSSYGKLKDIGLLKPNPLKIHDMLGNVSEMTCSFYRVEYYQGRMGGFVFKGGNYTTAKKQLRSSMRGEIPFYKTDSRTKKVQASKQITMGIRIVISSPIYASRGTFGKLEKDWDRYIKEERSAPVTKPVITTLPIPDRADIQIEDAFKSLKSIVDELNKAPDASQTILNHLGVLNASFTNINSTIRKAENESAYAWINMSSHIARFIRDWMLELGSKQRALKVAEETGKSAYADKFRKQTDDLEQTISDGLSRYGDIFNQLITIRKEAVDKAFEKFKTDMKRKNDVEQIRFGDLSQQHYNDYLQSRRIEADKWKADLEKLL